MSVFKYTKNRSLRSFLIFTITLFLFIFLVMYSGVLIWITRVNGLEESKNMAKLGHVAISNSLEQLLVQSYHTLYRIRDNFHESGARIETLFGTSFEKIEILDENDDVIYIIPPSKSEQLGMNRSGFESTKYLRNNVPIYLSSPFIPMGGSFPVITLGVSAGKSIISGDIHLTELINLSTQFKEMFGDEYRFLVTDNFGVYISDNSVENVQQRRFFNDIDIVKELLAEGREFYTKGSFRNRRLIGAWHMENTGFYIIIVNNLSVQRDVLYRYSLFILFFAFIGLLFLEIILVGMARKMLKAFNEFTVQSEKIAIGDYSRIIGEQPFKEFSQLRNAFTVMQSEIMDRNILLEKQAFEDELTGLKNRPVLLSSIRAKINDENTGRFGVILINVDGIKIINALYGLEIGDKFLIEISSRLVAERYDVFRTVGDEFAILVDVPSDSHRKNNIEEVERVHKKICRNIEVDGKLMNFSVCFGIAVYPDNGDNLSSILTAADFALSTAKLKGYNSIHIYDNKMKHQDARKTLLKREMKKAILQDEFLMHYQPQFYLDTERLRGVEALIRWESPVCGHVNPAEFIPIAEESGFILELGEWIIKKVCSDSSSFQKEFGEKCMFSINISPKQILNIDLVRQIEENIALNNLSPADIELEITESYLVEYTNSNLDIIDHLKNLGLKLSLDDFGTGYSSLSYLNNIPFDVLKIDRSFIQDIGKSLKHEKLVHSIILTAQGLDLEVIAEGIETKEQLHFLKQMSCDIIQGYYTGKPMSFDDLLVFVSQFD